MTHDKSDLERAREYADRVCEHDIDSIRYGMKNAHGVAMTDFLAGRDSRDGEVEALKKEIEELRFGVYDLAFHRGYARAKLEQE